MIFRQELSLRGLETRQLIGTDLQLNKPPEPRPRPLLEPVRPLLNRHATRARAMGGGAARRRFKLTEKQECKMGGDSE